MVRDDPDRWQAFKARYAAELDRKADALAPLRQAACEGDVTLVFSAKDTEHNNALALKEYLELTGSGQRAASSCREPTADH